MKVIKTIGHPAFFITLYLLLLIEGDHFGGFYLLYLLLALPHGATYATLAVCGIGLLLIHHYFIAHPFLPVCGTILMLLSLFVFFSKGNKNETFTLTFPLLTFILTGVCMICYLVRSLTPVFFSRHPFAKL